MGVNRDKPQKIYRTELKFLCEEQQLIELEAKLFPICVLDKYVKNSHSYKISSLYLDTLNHKFFDEKEDGVDRREKYRIRIYDKNMDNIVLECKEKLYQKNHKQQCKLSKKQFENILSGDVLYSNFSTNVLLRKFFLQYNMHYLRPSVIVEYDRTPYTYVEGNVRITFDRNICSSYDIDNIGDAEMFKRLILPTNTHILEVKYDQYIPNFLLKIINGMKFEQVAFSKYYYCQSQGGDK